MKEIKSYRLRKCSDVDMENPYFEILDQDETTIMDISKTDEGEVRVLFYENVSTKWMPMTMLEEIIREATKQFAE